MEKTWNPIFTLFLIAVFECIAGIILKEPDGHQHFEQQVNTPLQNFVHDYDTIDIVGKYSEHHQKITDCMFVTSETGPFSYISFNDDEKVCGVYFLTDPDKIIELHIVNFDVPCNLHGLLSIIDGWELNGQLFPNFLDHQLPLESRVREFCGRGMHEVFVSTQNAAVIQYRIPARGKGFSVIAHYPKNPTPCNILAVSTTEAFTLRNYGRRSNCTLSAVYPGIVEVIGLDVGASPAKRFGSRKLAKPGVAHTCVNKNMVDEVQVGGSHGLDTSKLNVLSTICGRASKSESQSIVVGYDVTSVRLTSSGFFRNSVTISIHPIASADIPDSSFNE